MGSIVSGIFGGGSKSQPTPSGSGSQFTQTVVREAPGIEERKIELMDLARAVADQPVTIPAMQVAPFGALEQQGLTAAGTTGVGAPTVTSGIGQLLAAQTPNINQFLNPFQSYVVDEINRQAAQAQNRLAASAVASGAFGGGREGVAQAELERARLGQVGLAQQRGFGQALAAAQQQQRQQAAIGQQLASIGAGQQQMAQADLNQLFAAGGLQRQLAQATLDAARQSQLQQAAEPFQRAEFLSNIYAAGPKSTSSLVASTAPQTSPLAQSIGTGIGAFQAFQGMQGGR
jgi:hypothetical protein|tara:strand:+ start:480 stop:1343 length:864 start_codon:yes stop_codon:yes gene_type:complete